MSISRGLFAIAAAASIAAAAGAAKAAPGVPGDAPTIVHVLNRLGYGPRPGDVEHVRQIGVAKYIDQQLHPERIKDEALDALLEPLETLRMTTTAEIAREYVIPAQQPSASRSSRRRGRRSRSRATPPCRGCRYHRR